ncbi:MAG: FAD:protein FMN transferase [Clostridia bacterium]|nr:FAD:protein FMN transferase [Clostridia bacterium]
MEQNKKTKNSIILKRFACALAVIFAAVFLICPLPVNNTASAATSEPYSKTMYVFGTSADLVLYGDFSSEESQAANKDFGNMVSSYLYSLESRLSTTYKTSYVYAFNNAAAGATVQIDEDTYNILALALEIYEETGGYYNAGVYNSVNLFGFGEGGSGITEVPEDEYIQAFLTLSQCFGDITLYGQDGSYYAVKPADTVTVGGTEYSLSIDLGGIAKGYATDKVKEMLSQYGYGYSYFSFGSSSMYIARSYSSEDGLWTLSVRNPRSQSGEGYATTRAAEAAISTSGDYENYCEIDGVRYCHIINPETGLPVNVSCSGGVYSQTAGIISATVIGGSAAANDARTTAIMAMGIEKAVEYCSSLGDMQFMLVINKQNITEGASSALSQSGFYLHDNGGTYAVLTNIDGLTVDEDFLSEGTINYTAIYIIIAVVAVCIVAVSAIIIYNKRKNKKQTG